MKSGNEEEVLKFLNEKNLYNPKIFEFNYIYWKMRESKELFFKVMDIMQKRGIFDYNLWTFSFMHKHI
jgi:hypothetical protein